MRHSMSASGPIAAELRCPRYVRLSLNFRHDVAAPRTTLRARTDKRRRTPARQRGRHSAGRIRAHWAGTEVSDDLSHLNSRPCTLHQCRAHSLHQVQCSCRCCQPLRSPRPLTSGTSITGMATASCPAIISRPTTAFQFMVRRDQSAALQAMRQATGIMAGGTISAILGFSVDATTAAVSARAGLGRPSGRCGIVGSYRIGACRNIRREGPTTDNAISR
jgi:hypothetical protein